MNAHPILRKNIITALVIILLAVSTASTPVFADVEGQATDLDIEPKYITVYLDPQFGTVDPEYVGVTAGSVYLDLPEPTRPNYVFDGWYTDTSYTTKITEDYVFGDTSNGQAPISYITLYAKWTGELHTIEFDPNKGTVDTNSSEYEYGAKLGTLPKPKRPSFDFMGWYTKKKGGKKISTKTTMKYTTTTALYAKWAPKWYLQTDKRWAKKWYRVHREKSTIGNAGCGPTTMAMAITSIKKKTVNPKKACKWSRNHGYKAYMSGTKDGYFKAHGRKYGIKVNQIYYSDLRHLSSKSAKKYHNKAKNAVKNGNWVIVLAGKGRWTSGSGHFILWYATEDGYALIRDSNSKKAKRAKAKVSTLTKQAKRYWIVKVPKSKRV